MNCNNYEDLALKNCRFIAPIVLAGIIAGASAIAGAGINAYGANRSAKTAKRTSMDLARYNSMLEEEMYNKYQSPSAQMAQYRAAGLNPHLIYSQSINGPSAGQANYSDSMSPNYGSYVAEGIMSAVNMYQSIMMNQAKISQAEAVAEAQRTKAALDESRITAQNIANDFSQAANAYKIEGLTKDNAMKAIDLDIKQRYAALRAKAELEEVMAKGNLTRQQYVNARKQVEVYDQQIKESEARVRNMQNQIALGFGELNLANRQFAEGQMMNKHKRAMDFREYSLRNRNLGIEYQKMQHQQAMNIAEMALKKKKYDYDWQSGITKQNISVFPFIKGF